MWCVAELDEEYIERMEDILALYERDYNEDEPVVCFDEKPVQLLQDMREAEQSPEKIKKRDHQYKRKGTANIFCGVEPLTGCYYNYVTENKKGAAFAKVINRLASKYPDANTIHLVLDNYSTHTKKSLTDFYGQEKGGVIWEKFTIHYTPKNASWLDQAEIAIGLYSKQCLGKSRVPDIDTLRERTRAWNKAINKKALKIQWGFTVDKAKEVFKYE